MTGALLAYQINLIIVLSLFSFCIMMTRACPTKMELNRCSWWGKMGFRGKCHQTFCGFHVASVTSKMSPNVYKSWPKRISLEKLKILTPLQKLPKNVGNLGKITVATGFEKSNKLLNLVTLITSGPKLVFEANIINMC